MHVKCMAGTRRRTRQTRLLRRVRHYEHILTASSALLPRVNSVLVCNCGSIYASARHYALNL